MWHDVPPLDTTYGPGKNRRQRVGEMLISTGLVHGSG